MPRQDVPYGGAICRLRERIAEIFDKLGEKLHTINGVPGDGDGNVNIVSGDAAITISDNQGSHYIEIGLDHGALPAATVSSVNGQTGAVALDAGDIPTVGGDVQADLQDLANDISGNTAAINAEVLARQNADASLQTNINAVSASLPAAAAAAVAADPTVAYVASEINNKVDKITSGSSLKAYTHTGATQGEVSVVDGTTANSIGIRDANGRMQAADPASGATNKSLVTANWISQTGMSRPNNVLHTTGEEVIAAIKRVSTGGGIVFETTQLQNRLKIKDNSLSQGTLGGSYVNLMTLRDSNDLEIATIRYQQSSTSMQIVIIFNDGTQHPVTIASWSV